MKYNQILITGGAGFVGSSLALYLRKQFPQTKLLCLDNFSRKGSRLQAKRLEKEGIPVIEGDVRNPEDLAKIDADLMLECSAEPSVQAGLGESPRYLLDTNLMGTINCLEWARERKAGFLFLSTSRVFPIGALEAIPHIEAESRFEWLPPDAEDPRRTAQGITPAFTMDGVRSLYGSTKFASEILVREYAACYDMESLVNRCGVIAGPWQMGKTDQGFIALWVARHIYGGSLSYNGYGGFGKQVRDFIHIHDLCRLVEEQLGKLQGYRGEVFQLGGGRENSLSLLELTALCEQRTENQIEIEPNLETHPNDLRILLLDSGTTLDEFEWAPLKNTRELVWDIAQWIEENYSELKSVLGG